MECKPNSHKYKAEQKAAEEKRQISKVVSGAVKTKKKGGVGKLAEVFISEDVSNVKTYLVQDILLPTIKKAILGALDMTLPGGSGFTHGGRSSSGPKVSYRQFYDDPRDRHHNSVPARSRFDFDTITYEYRSDAEAVLDQMQEVIERYGFVSVSDMYEMARLDQPYTGNKYGWTSVASVKIVRRQDGYIIDLPKAMPLD